MLHSFMMDLSFVAPSLEVKFVTFQQEKQAMVRERVFQKPHVLLRLRTVERMCRYFRGSVICRSRRRLV